MKFSRSFLTRIAGEPERFPLTHLISNWLCFTGAVIGHGFFVSDFLFSMPLSNLIFDLIISAYFWVLYFFSRTGRSLALSIHGFSVAALVFCVVNWFSNGGMEGPTLVVSLGALVAVVVINRDLGRFVYTAFWFLASLAIVLVERLVPRLVQPYSSPDARFRDVLFTYLYALLIVFITLRTVMLLHERAQKKLEEKTLALEETLVSLKKAQESLIQSEKMAALGQLLAHLGHEIASPLSVIRSSLENSTQWWKQDLPRLREVLGNLDSDQIRSFWVLLEDSETVVPDRREQRSIRKSLAADLEALGVPGDEWAGQLTERGFFQLDSRWSALLTTERGRAALLAALRGRDLGDRNHNTALALEKIGNLVTALKSYSRSERPDEEPEWAEVSEGLDTVVTLYCSPLRNQVRVLQVYREVPKVLCRQDELIQVWTNLVLNALQAMNYEGVLTLRIEQKDSAVEVSVSDTGPGVPDELKTRIFQPFFTTKPRGEGTGLGLDIVSVLVARHRGTIEVFDAPEGGAQFVVRLPVAGATSV